MVGRVVCYLGPGRLDWCPPAACIFTRDACSTCAQATRCQKIIIVNHLNAAFSTAIPHPTHKHTTQHSSLTAALEHHLHYPLVSRPILFHSTDLLTRLHLGYLQHLRNRRSHNLRSILSSLCSLYLAIATPYFVWLGKNSARWTSNPCCSRRAWAAVPVQGQHLAMHRRTTMPRWSTSHRSRSSRCSSTVEQVYRWR